MFESDDSTMHIHQLHWKVRHCSECDPRPKTETPYAQAGVHSFISPVKHHIEAFSCDMVCTSCGKQLDATMELVHIPMDMDDPATNHPMPAVSQ